LTGTGTAFARCSGGSGSAIRSRRCAPRCRCTCMCSTCWAAVPLVVGRHDVPRRLCRAGLAQHGLEGPLVVLPGAPLPDVAGGELPVRLRMVDAVEEPLGLLPPGQVQQDLDDTDPVAGQAALPVVDLPVAAGPDPGRPRPRASAPRPAAPRGPGRRRRRRAARRPAGGPRRPRSPGRGRGSARPRSPAPPGAAR
jgi:hypothetical protein